MIGRLFSNAIAKVKDMKNFKADRYIWMDLEMTGLDATKDKILEVSCVITKPDLTSVHEGINVVIYQPEDVLNSMNDWCLVNHEQSGLTQACRESKCSITKTDELVSNYIKKFSDDKGTRYLAGNSVHQDRLFIDKYMPLTSSLLHYRILDVSTVKLLCRHWYLDEYFELDKKKPAHRAFDDIWESINELKRYQKAIFKS